MRAGAPRSNSPRGLAVLGGSFNPPTLAHVELARAALAKLPVDQLLVIPAGDHPHKRNHDMAPAADRVAMCRLAFAELPAVRVDDRELRRPGPSFTVDTLAELRSEAPERPIYFLIGSDNLPLLPSWREPQRLLTTCTVVTFARPGFPLTPTQFANLPLPPDVRARLQANVLDVGLLPYAATELRTRWRNGERTIPGLPAKVRDYLLAHDLYR